MRRREFIAGLSGAASWTLAARSQQRPPAIGLLGSASPQQWTKRLSAFREGLSHSGYDDGRNVAIEYRWAEGHNERLPRLAADLAERNVAVMVVLGNTPSALAAKAASLNIPVVFRVAGDPVDFGLVASMNKPGANVTGITTLGVGAGPKQLELLHEVVPSALIVAALLNPSNPVSPILSESLSAAARKLGLRFQVLAASADDELEGAFAHLKELKAGALVVGVDGFFNSRNERIAALALRAGLPAISPYREFAEAGGLMSYGGSIVDASRQAGVYTARILNGEKPADLPVLQATAFELVVNLRTAKAVEVHIPPDLLARADEVIE